MRSMSADSDGACRYSIHLTLGLAEVGRFQAAVLTFFRADFFPLLGFRIPPLKT